MDPKQFDGLVRLIGSGHSRRNVLKTITGGALAAIAAAVGIGEAGAAARKRANGLVCSKNADCTTNVCYPMDVTGRRTCGPDLCKDQGVVCKQLDECHVTGVCEPTTGICSNPNAADGSFCHRFAGTCSGGTCQLFSTLSCTLDSECQSHCPTSGDDGCSCGNTIEGDPVCHHSSHGCAGHQCAGNGDCADYGVTATCIRGYCSTPNYYCATGGDCPEGYACVNLNGGGAVRGGGCGGCDLFTGSVLGICQLRCTS